MKPASDHGPTAPAIPAGPDVIRKVIGQGSLGAAVIGMVYCFLLAFAGLLFFTNQITVYPENTDAPLDFALIMGFELLLILVFFSVFGLYFRTDTKVMPFKNIVVAFSAAPFLLFPISIFVIYPMPFVTSVLAVLPPMGLSIGIYSLASRPESGFDGKKLARLRILVCLQLVWFLAVAATFTPRVVLPRRASIAFVFPSLIFLGFLIALEGFRIRDTAVAGVAGHIDPARNNVAGPVEKEGRPVRPAIARSPFRAGALFFIFVSALVPGIWLLDTPPQVAIVDAEYIGGGLDVTVVNHGAQAIAMVELWGDGQYITTIQFIEGFGMWEGRGLGASGTHSLTLRVGVQEVAAQKVYSKPYVPDESCDIIWLAIGIAAASGAMPAVVKKR